MPGFGKLDPDPDPHSLKKLDPDPHEAMLIRKTLLNSYWSDKSTILLSRNLQTPVIKYRY
jgi:hypothetical protein